MAGNVLDITSLIQPDQKGTAIANFWMTWNSQRQNQIAEWKEVRDYIFATDTTKTTNSKLPWKNKTTIPKLCQTRDNLFAQYMLSMFPKRKWLEWDAEDRSSNSEEKQKAIKAYMCYVIGNRRFKEELAKCVLDYIDTGNSIVMPEWVDERVETEGQMKSGYVGPLPRRINPHDIVCNPIASSWENSPKIIRSIVTLGEVKKLINSLSTDDTREAYDELWKYMKDLRETGELFGGELSDKDRAYAVDGFTSYQAYLGSNYVEILTFYGDLYDREHDVFLENKIITVVDRHKILSIKDNPSLFGKPPIYHVGWRVRQDNLWAMGPLANLVGLQYRIDHVENLKADVFDLLTFPPLKIKGHVDDFEWGPMSRIYIGDKDGDVEMMAPPFQILQANIEIQQLVTTIEEMAGSPKEAMGFRTPGEKTKYEVQRLENAASRIFQSKITQFEESFLEPLLNSLLELAKRKVTSDILIRYFNDETKSAAFLDLSPADITGEGRIRPFAARHFAEQAELVQNLTSLASSPLGQIVQPHLSSIRLSRMLEQVFDIQDYKLFVPFIALSEQADAQRIAQANEAMVLMEATQATGLTPDDTSQPFMQQNGQPMPPQGQPGPIAPEAGAPPPIAQSNRAIRGPLGGGGY